MVLTTSEQSVPDGFVVLRPRTRKQLAAVNAYTRIKTKVLENALIYPRLLRSSAAVFSYDKLVRFVIVVTIYRCVSDFVVLRSTLFELVHYRRGDSIPPQRFRKMRWLRSLDGEGTNKAGSPHASVAHKHRYAGIIYDFEWMLVRLDCVETEEGETVA